MSHTDRFADRATDYVAGRPSYPAEAIDALLDGLGDPGEVTVADLGAGTGISSRLLAARGAHVFAIEPNAAMRGAAEADPNVEWRDGTAEHTGLSEADVDLVTAFQSFHWFDHPQTLEEIVRILRPGGRAAVIYNERDESDSFTAEYGAIVRRYRTDETERRRADGRAGFEAFDGWVGGSRRIVLRNAHPLDLDGLLARARSTSYLPKSGPVADQLHAEIRALVAQHARDGAVTLALRTIVIMGDVGAG